MAVESSILYLFASVRSWLVCAVPTVTSHVLGGALSPVLAETELVVFYTPVPSENGLCNLGKGEVQDTQQTTRQENTSVHRIVIIAPYRSLILILLCISVLFLLLHTLFLIYIVLFKLILAMLSILVIYA